MQADQKIILVSQEGVSIPVDARIMNMCGVIFDMLDDYEGNYSGIEVPLPVIKEQTVRDIIMYCEHFDFNCKRVLEHPLKSNNLSEAVED